MFKLLHILHVCDRMDAISKSKEITKPPICDYNAGRGENIMACIACMALGISDDDKVLAKDDNYFDQRRIGC